MGRLSDLAIKYNTDKQPKDHNYTPIYEEWLNKIDVKSMLEVGFGPGASMRMWLEYYPDSSVYCLEYGGEEYEQVWDKPNLDLPRLNLIMGNSTIKQSWEKVPHNLDFIVDDGDHHAEAMLATFYSGFSHLRAGGLYFIEDLHCPFESKYGATHLMYDWMYDIMLAQQAPHVQTGGDFYKARPYMDANARDIYSIHSYKSMIVIQKA
jgi:hypothetical protein